jgi:hypothetical protein
MGISQDTTTFYDFEELVLDIDWSLLFFCSLSIHHTAFS